MIKETTRNLAIGMTVLIALVLLGGMILLFTGLPEVLQRGYTIRILAGTTHDAHTGDTIHLSGIRVGRLMHIRFTDPARPADGVTFVGRIDHDVRLPGNVQAYFFTKGLAGAAYIELKADGAGRRDPVSGEVLELFPTDDSIVINSVHVGRGLIPPELIAAIKSLAKLSENLNLLIAPPPVPTTAPGPTTDTAPSAAGPPGLVRTIEKLDRALDALSAVLGDAENQQNIKASLSNLTEATGAARDAMTALTKFAEEARQTATSARHRIEELSEKLITDAEKISELMSTMNRAAEKIESGEGTVGKLLNDPDLYNSFLAATAQMNQLLDELRQLVAAWKKGGVEIKIK